MINPFCGLLVIFCGFISHLIGRETINIPEIFSGIHSFTGKTVNLPRKTVSNIVDRFLRTGSVQPGVGGNKIRTARTDDVVLYTEFCKRQRPSVYAAEVQKELIENQVVLPANVPSQAVISRVLTSDLGYLYKKMTIVPKERLTDNAQERLDEYLTVCSACDPRNMHFFDESSVIKTMGNRNYAHAPVGLRAVKIQRYESNATYTVNLLHSIFGVEDVNILPGPLNGLELLNCFAEALQEHDIFGTPLLKQGDLGSHNGQLWFPSRSSRRTCVAKYAWLEW